MKKALSNVAFVLVIILLGGYDNFFNPDIDVTLSNENYISEESEIYSGYIGIMTKAQAIGDEVTYLNELRREVVVPTVTAPTKFYNLYNYGDDLGGSLYADPSGFHEVINVCSNHLQKLKTYKEKNSISGDHYKTLVSSTLRVRAQVFMTTAKAYGEVAWVDKLVTSLRDLPQSDVLSLDETMVVCKNLLDISYGSTDGTYETARKDWVNPDTEPANGEYRRQDIMTLPHYALYARICLWLGRYQQCVNLTLNKMNSIYQSTTNQSIAFLCSDMLLSHYTNFSNNETPYDYEPTSAVMYDYRSRQTNSLLEHFNSDYPNKYWLAPVEVAVERSRDNGFGPLDSKDKNFRMSYTVSGYNGKWVINKLRPVSKSIYTAYHDDVLVYTYRGADLYFMLTEALNQLGRRSVVDALTDVGINAYSSEFDIGEGGTYSGNWYGIIPHQTSDSTVYYYLSGTTGIGSHKYGDRGIRGAEVSYSNSGARIFTSNVQNNDKEILKEMILEMTYEEKVHLTMTRMVKRYNDNSFMAKYISEKYKTTGNAEGTRSKIMNGDYFIEWSLR